MVNLVCLKLRAEKIVHSDIFCVLGTLRARYAKLAAVLAAAHATRLAARHPPRRPPRHASRRSALGEVTGRSGSAALGIGPTGGPPGGAGGSGGGKDDEPLDTGQVRARARRCGSGLGHDHVRSAARSDLRATSGPRLFCFSYDTQCQYIPYDYLIALFGFYVRRG